MDRQILIKKSAPHPRLRKTGTGGRKRARKYSSTSDVADGGRDVMALTNMTVAGFAVFGVWIVRAECGVRVSVGGLAAEGVVRMVFADVGCEGFVQD